MANIHIVTYKCDVSIQKWPLQKYKNYKHVHVYYQYSIQNLKLPVNISESLLIFLVLNVQWCAHRCRGFQDKIQVHVVSKYMYHIILTMVPVGHAYRIWKMCLSSFWEWKSITAISSFYFQQTPYMQMTLIHPQTYDRGRYMYK